MSKSWLRIGLIAVGTIIWSAAFATTGVPDPTLCTATSAGGAMFTCPAGDGESLASAGATITATIVDNSSTPIPGFPAEDLWIQSVVADELSFCTGSNFADWPTDGNGQTTFSGTLAGGGYTQSGLDIYVNGTPITGSPPLAIDVNNVDLNGDLTVDLCDIILFDPDIGSSAFRSDFNHDGVVNLLDIGIFSYHQCHYCGTPTSVEFSGEIGVFFDPEGTQTGIEGIDPGVLFSFYVVAFDATGGIAGYQFGISVDPNIQIGSVITYPAGSNNFGGAPGDVRVGTGGDCLPDVGAVLLVEVQAVLMDVVTNGSVCLGPSPSACATEPDGPAYLSCEGDCVWRAFYSAYEGCAVVNGSGPVSDTRTTWGAVKTLYHH